MAHKLIHSSPFSEHLSGVDSIGVTAVSRAVPCPASQSSGGETDTSPEVTACGGQSWDEGSLGSLGVLERHPTAP